MEPACNRHFIELKDLRIEANQIYAFSKGVIPETLRTPTFYTISIWCMGINKDPITITYASEEERDAEYDILIKETKVTYY